MRTMVGLLTLVMVLVAGCGDDDGGNVTADARPTPDAPAAPDAAAPDASVNAMLPETLPDPLPTGDPAVTLATINTALPTTIKYAAEREPFIIDALNTLEADVVCLQEIWDVLHNQDYGNALFYQHVKDAWPYAYWSTIDTKGWGNGLLILSKHPLYRGREIRYEAQPTGGNAVLDRIAIGVDVVTDDSYFHFLCTHLHHEASEPQIRMDEIDELNAWAMTEGYFDGPTFLLGDFNAGPKTSPSTCEPNCTPTDVVSYPHLLQNWTDANEGWDQCTFCVAQANPMQLLAPDPNYPDQRIDHCLYRNIGDSVQQSREIILDEPITIEHDTEGTVQTYYSDHLAVSCTYGPPTP
jgi:endonuclease/exonuclease/phosphatase family metal-dependent hydrolase